MRGLLAGVLLASLDSSCGFGGVKLETAEFLAHYGNFLAIWSSFELMLEMLIIRQLRLTKDEASIVCAGRALDVKLNILKTLLHRDANNAPGIKLLAEARTIAERNSFLHGFFRVNKPTGAMMLVRREVKTGHRVFQKTFNAAMMLKHAENFRTGYLAAAHWFDVTDEHMDSYGARLEVLALAQEDEEAPRPRSSRSSGKVAQKRSTKKRR